MKSCFQTIILILLITFISCSKKINFQVNKNTIHYSDYWDNNINMTDKENVDNLYIDNIYSKRGDTVIYLKTNTSYICKIIIKYPETKSNIKGNILMLHGFGRSYDEWCSNSNFCSAALQQNYILIIPDLGHTNYALTVYPETIEKYQRYPTITWLINEMVPYLQNNLNLLKNNDYNCVCGISTGARGATLLAYYLPDVFKAAASISGDFDITKIPNDFIYRNFFGNDQTFQKRWKKESLATKYKKYKTFTYIAHGLADKVVPAQQSIDMYNLLIKTHPKSIFVSNFVKNAEHNYKYWNTETNNILSFFNDNYKKVNF